MGEHQFQARQTHGAGPDFREGFRKQIRGHVSAKGSQVLGGNRQFCGPVCADVPEWQGIYHAMQPFPHDGRMLGAECVKSNLQNPLTLGRSKRIVLASKEILNKRNMKETLHFVRQYKSGPHTGKVVTIHRWATGAQKLLFPSMEAFNARRIVLATMGPK